VLAPLAELVLVAGGEDMSSCLLHPMRVIETAAIKNNIFFISYSLSSRAPPQMAASRATLGRKGVWVQYFIFLIR
jgi:hypothetical protein